MPARMPSSPPRQRERRLFRTQLDIAQPVFQAADQGGFGAAGGVEVDLFADGLDFGLGKIFGAFFLTVPTDCKRMISNSLSGQERKIESRISRVKSPWPSFLFLTGGRTVKD
jgi:hypothetical protein